MSGRRCMLRGCNRKGRVPPVAPLDGRMLACWQTPAPQSFSLCPITVISISWVRPSRYEPLHIPQRRPAPHREHAGIIRVMGYWPADRQSRVVLTNILAQDGAFVKNFTNKIKLTRLIFLRAIRTTTQSNYLIISERDIIRTGARRDDVFSLPVSQVMTKEIIIGLPQDDLMSVAHTMTEKRFRNVPIVEQGGTGRHCLYRGHSQVSA